MRFFLLILALSFLLTWKGYAQSFQVNVAGYSGSAFYSPYSYTINGPFGSITQTSSTFTTSSVPTSFSIEFRNGSTPCTISGTVSNPSSYCATGSGGGPTASCGGGGVTAGISLGTSPIIAFTSGTSAADSYCVNEDITLTGSPGFTGYGWQYRVETGGWQNFNPGSGNSVTFGIEDVFGPSYAPYLNKEIYFRFHVGGCTSTTSNAVGPYLFSVTPLQPTAHTKGEISCYNSANGSLTISSYDRSFISGETLTNLHLYTQPNLNVTYFVKSSPTNTISNISPGTYYVLVEGSVIPCSQSPSFYGPITFTNPAPVTFTNNTPVLPSCHISTTGTKDNGSITVNASGGTGTGYQYSKDNGLNYQSSNVLTGLTTGNYTVMVKDDNGCPSGSSVIGVGQPADISLGLPGRTDVSCFGGNNGTITMNSTGTATLTYSKDGTNFGGNVFTGLTENTYTITVKDGNGCTKQSAPVAIDAPDVITATATPTSSICYNDPTGSISVTAVSGGAGGYTYSLNGTLFQTGTTFSDLLSNPYTVTIKDANGCTITRNTTVGQPSAIGVSSTPTLITCAGGNNGSVQISATNTIGTPTYSLNGSAFQASNTFTNLTANTYTIAVKDGNGCTGTGNTTITSNPIITGPITISTAISCNGGNNGALNLTPGGGVGPYTFTWSNGATTEDITNLTANTYTVTVKDNVNCTQIFNRVLTHPLPITITPTPSDYNGSNISCFGGNNGAITTSTTGGNSGYTYLWSNSATTQNINTLTAGTYTVTVTDNKSCTGNQSITLTQPTQLTSTISGTTNINCFGTSTGSITLSTTGGTTSYQYSINGGTNWQSSPTFTNLATNSYTILTRDANSCNDSDNTTLTSPTNLVLAIDNTTNTTCNQNNGAISASATGGVSSYSFAYFNSGNTQIGSNSTINNLAAGVYRVVVTDQNSCTKQQNVTVSSSNGPAIAVQTITAASCSNTSDGTATITISQGQAPYTILWPNNQTTATATNLAGGDYTVEVRDNTNCLALQTVTVPAPQLLTIQTTTQQDPNCNGNADGQITVTAQGGNGSYTYNWNTGQTTSTITNLPAGTYTVITKDSKNCQATQQYTLTNPPVFAINLGADEKICEGQTITKTISEANATYSWTGPNSFTSNQQQVSISQPGNYSATVISQKGCQASDSFVLSFDTDLLKADFLMVSEAFTGDTIIVIDISWPVPTASNWQFDANAVIIDESPDYSLIRFDEAGTYSTTLQAQLAQCASTRSQSITIIDNPDEEGKTNGKKGEKIIRTLHVYPNPAQQNLTIEIELNRINDTQLELYHLHSNKREFVKTFEGNHLYETEVRLDHLQTGLYVVVVKAGDEIKSVKVIKL